MKILKLCISLVKKKKKVIFCLTCLRYFERFSSSLTEAYVGFLLEVFCNNG